jgi:type IV pilus assembly protein PilX
MSTRLVNGTASRRGRASVRGMVLISALLLLLVMTILGAAMFHTLGVQENTAGNTREKQRALHAAESAQTYAEWWLVSASGSNANNGSVCNSVTAAPQVCSNMVQNVTQLPWSAGISYTPPMLTVGPAGVTNDYYAAPSFYISFLEAAYDPTTGTQTHVYQVDAQGYGGTQNAAAVVESTYAVSVTYTTQTNDGKYVNLSGP